MKLWKLLGIELYEVGDIYINMSGNNPGLRFKGTWELIAQGRTLVGIDPADSDFNTPGKTGGSKFTEKHNHARGSYQSGNEAEGYGLTPSGAFTNRVMVNGPGFTSEFGTGNAGNLQPYFVCYIWQRIA